MVAQIDTGLGDPKQKASDEARYFHLYPYYAGYTAEFVESVMRHPLMPEEGEVLDPWNGSGTTTTVCSMLGRRSYGFDLNPSMVVVAKARLLPTTVDWSLRGILAAIVERARERRRVSRRDALLDFFGEQSAAGIRAVAEAISEVLADDGWASRQPTAVSDLSALAAFYYVLLFRAVRQAAAAQRTSNPTWVKRPREGQKKLSLNFENLLRLLSDELVAILASRRAQPIFYSGAWSQVGLADSRALPLRDASIAGVVTSPPYCTRIDYAVATRLELAILGVGEFSGFGDLRRSLIGTTLSSEIPRKKCSDLKLDIVLDALERIRTHTSKASSLYYFRTYRDYFEGINESMRELGRVLRTGGLAAIVVQDSFYKEIHIDLAEIYQVLGAHYGLRVRSRHDFRSRRTMRRVHKHVRPNAKLELPVESAILLTKD